MKRDPEGTKKTKSMKARQKGRILTPGGKKNLRARGAIVARTKRTGGEFLSQEGMVWSLKSGRADGTGSPPEGGTQF